MRTRTLIIIVSVLAALGVMAYVIAPGLFDPDVRRARAMTRLERSGLVIRRSCGSMETVVNPKVWSEMRETDQQSAAAALGAYCAEQGSGGEMTILEDQTRRKLAHWNGTAFQRF